MAKHSRYRMIKVGKERVTLSLHVYVWLVATGAWARGERNMPEGHELHHKDFDPYNNDLSNLELMTKSAHRKLHWTINTEAKVKRLRTMVASLSPEKVAAMRQKQSRSLKENWATATPQEKERRLAAARAAHRKFSDDDVREIRRLHVKGARGKVAELCARFKTSRHHLRRIATGEVFPDVK